MSEMATQYIDIPLGGVDTKTAPELVVAPKSLQLENVSLGEVGAYVVRDGYRKLTNNTVINGNVADELSTLKRVYSDGEALWAIDGRRLYNYQENENKWVESEIVCMPVSRRRTIKAPPRGSGYLSQDLVYHSNGYLCAALSSSPDDFSIVLLDAVTGVKRRTDAFSVTGCGTRLARLTTCGSYIVLFYFDATGGNHIKARTLDTQAPASGWSAAVNVATTHATAYHFDVADEGDGGGSSVHLVFTGAAAVSAVLLTFPAGVPTVSVGPTAYFDVADKSIACARYPGSTGDKLVITYCGAAVGCIARDIVPATLVETANWLVDAVATTQDRVTVVGYFDQAAVTNRAYVAYSTPQTTPMYAVTTTFRTLNLDNHTTATPTSATEPGVVLGHKAFLKGSAGVGEVLVGLRRAQDIDDVQCTIYTYLDRGFVRYPVAQHQRGISGFDVVPGNISRVCAANADLTKYVFGALSYAVLGPDGDAVYTNDVLELDFDPDVAFNALRVREQLLFMASIPQLLNPDVRHQTSPTAVDQPAAIDGLVPLHSPLQPTLAGGTTGALTPSAEYHYKLVYEYYDDAGRAHFGIPSIGVAMTLGGGGDSIDVTTPAYPSPQPGYSTPKISLYRTLGDAAELIYYFVTSLSAAGGTYTDTISDAALATHRVLYTDSGELDNFPPPSTAALCLWKNRIVALDSDTGKLWPSKTLIDGEWPGFHEGLAVNTDVHTAKPVFVSSENESLIVWWVDAIGVVYGEAGTDTGQPGTLSQPQLLPTRGVGLRDRRSLVGTPVGQFFMSQRGVYLLGSDLSLSYVGRDVEAFNAYEITGAVAVDTQNEVRFSCSDGTILVYDYLQQQWHTFPLSRRVISSALWRGKHVVATLREDGEGADNAYGVWVQTQGETTDPNNTAFFAGWSSAWIKGAGALGDQRVRNMWLKGTFPETAEVDVYNDFDGSTVVQTKADFGTGDANQDVEIPVGVDRNDVIPRVTVIGFTRLVAARVEIEVEKGTQRRARTVA